MMSRFGMIKASGFNNEDATKLNDVTKALTSIGIQAVDAQGQLRNFADVLNDVGSKWPTLTKNEQAYISTAMAGTFQRNRFLTLMQNYSVYQKNLANSMDSAGIAMKKFNIYQESTQAHLDKLTAVWQNFIKSIIDSNFIKFLLDLTSNFIKLIPVILGAASAIFIFTEAVGLMAKESVFNVIYNLFGGLITKLVGITGSATAAGIALASIATLGVAVAIVGIVALGKVIYDDILIQQKLKASLDDVNKAYREYQNLPSEESAAVFKTAVEIRIELLQKEIDKIRERNALLEKITTGENPAKIIGNSINSWAKSGATGIDPISEWFARIFDPEFAEKIAVAYEKQISYAQEQELRVSENQEMGHRTNQSEQGKKIEPVLDSEEYQAKVEADKKAYEDLISLVKQYTTQLGSLQQMNASITDGEKLSKDSILDLIDQYPEYAEQIASTNGEKEKELALTQALFEADKKRTAEAIDDTINQLKINNNFNDEVIANREKLQKRLDEINKDQNYKMADKYNKDLEALLMEPERVANNSRITKAGMEKLAGLYTGFSKEILEATTRESQLELFKMLSATGNALSIEKTKILNELATTDGLQPFIDQVMALKVKKNIIVEMTFDDIILAKQLKDQADKFKEITDKIKDYESEMSKLSTLYDNINEDGKISTDTLIDLINTYPEYSDQIYAMIGSKESELTLTELLFEANKTRAIAEQNAAIKQLELDNDLNATKVDAIKANDIMLKQLSANNPYMTSLSDYLKSDKYKKDMDVVNQISGRQKIIDIYEEKTVKTYTEGDKSPTSSDYKLPESMTNEIARLDALIVASETKSKEEQIKALEVKEKYLIKIKQEIKDLNTKGELEKDIQAIKTKQFELQKDINKENLDAVTSAQEAITKIVKDEVDKRKKVLEDAYDDFAKLVDKEIDKNKEKYASEDYDKDVKEQMTEIEKLQREKNSYLNAALSGDLTAQAKVAELDLEIQEKTTGLTDTQTGRSRDLQDAALEKMKTDAEETKNIEIKRLEAVYDETKITANALQALFASNLAGFDSILTKFLSGIGIADAEVKKIVGGLAPSYDAGKAGVKTLGEKGVTSNEASAYLAGEASGQPNKSPMQTAMEAAPYGKTRGAAGIKEDLGKLLALQASWATSKDRAQVTKDADALRLKYGITDKGGVNYPAWEYASFAKGGVADFTGPAILHGTKSRPETILNYGQAQRAAMGDTQNTPLRHFGTTNNRSIGDVTVEMLFTGPVDSRSIPAIQNGVMSSLKKVFVKGGQVRPVMG